MQAAKKELRLHKTPLKKRLQKLSIHMHSKKVLNNLNNEEELVA